MKDSANVRGRISNFCNFENPKSIREVRQNNLMSIDNGKTNDNRQVADQSRPMSSRFWDEFLESVDYEKEIDYLQKNFQLRQLLKEKEQENRSPDNSSLWAKYILPEYLLPTHIVSEKHFNRNVRKISTLFKKTLNGYYAAQSWDMRYFEPEEFAPATYRAELLLIKRKIYEQGDALWDLLTLDSADDADFLYYPEEFGSRIEVLKDLMKSTDSHSLSEIEIREFSNDDRTAGEHNEIDNVQRIDRIDRVEITNNLEDEDQGDDKDDEIIAFYHRTGFRRYADACRKTPEQSARQQTILQIRLDSYWLAWSQATRSSGLDFAYLATLKTAAEMRFYELIKLLLHYRQEVSNNIESNQTAENRQKTIETGLEVKYGEFARLMPLPILSNEATIRRQLETLCAGHTDQKFISGFTINKTDCKIDPGTNTGNHEKEFLIRFTF